MLKFAHISDTHVRSLSRHGEYRQVFQELNQKLNEQKPDYIIHTGDLFHTKTQNISPEYISLLSWWLTSLAAISPLIIVLGNHDGALTNLTREDAVSPIVNALNNPRIQLYKNSGVYNFHPGYNLCVYSIFDEAGWPGVRPVEGDVNIAIYHGPVWGSKTESDWELEGDFKVADFEQYDAALLGDIHQHQFLGYREYEIEIDEADLSNYPDAIILNTISNDG